MGHSWEIYHGPYVLSHVYTIARHTDSLVVINQHAAYLYEYSTPSAVAPLRPLRPLHTPSVVPRRKGGARHGRGRQYFCQDGGGPSERCVFLKRERERERERERRSSCRVDPRKRKNALQTLTSKVLATQRSRRYHTRCLVPDVLFVREQ